MCLTKLFSVFKINIKIKKPQEKKINNKLDIDDIEVINYSKKNSIMTKIEIKFYYKFLDIIKDNYIVDFQTPLSSVINKNSDTRYQNELYRIIDFCIIEKITFKPLLLIEINDNTHNEPSRINRDIKVKNICETANLPLIRFWLDKPNTDEYIKNTLKKYLNI